MKIEKIEGVGQKFAAKLRKSDVKTTGKLLNVGATKKGRQTISKDSGIPEKLILEWVNIADLMRVKGVGEEYSDLLEEAGVDSVKELRNRRPDNLHAAMMKTNKSKKLVRQLPSLGMVENWVKQAKKLPAKISY